MERADRWNGTNVIGDPIASKGLLDEFTRCISIGFIDRGHIALDLWTRGRKR